MDWWSTSHNWASGCTKVKVANAGGDPLEYSACKHCWVPEFLHTMTLDRGKFAGAVQQDDSEWSGQVRVLQDTLDKGDPIGWTQPQWVFVNIMSDTFHTQMPLVAIHRQLALSAMLPQHIWMLCTKRERRMHNVLNDEATLRGVRQQIEWWTQQPRMQRAIRLGRAQVPDQLIWPLPNLWAGVTLESDQMAHRANRWLSDTPAVVRFISCEPLITPLPSVQLDNLDWVVVGGEDLPPEASGYRPMHPDWVRDMRDRCASQGVAFWFKQWGSQYPVGQGGRESDQRRFRDPTPGDLDLWISPTRDIQDHPMLGYAHLRRMHKRAAGNLLDGQQIFQVPPGWETHPAILAHAEHHGIQIAAPTLATV